MKNIIRIEKRKKFTIISRMLLEDTRLKWSTRGLLAYLLCKPDNWILQVTDLKKNGDLGRDAIYSRIKEAIEYGYISRIYYRDEKGRVTGVEYTVHEDPKDPVPGNPDLDKPVTDAPDTPKASTTKDLSLPNTENTTTTTKIRKSSGSYFWHKQISEIQKKEIERIFESIDEQVYQDLLDELSGFIDKNLVQKDVVSLAEGLVKKALKGEFNLRLGIQYQESRLNQKRIQHQNEYSVKNVIPLPEADRNNPLVKQVMSIQRGDKNA